MRAVDTVVRAQETHSPGVSLVRAPIRVGMISLGCAKNLVDSEIMLGGIRARGMEITNSVDDADVVVVNTCGFIDAAKEESIEAILGVHEKRLSRVQGQQKLVVSGCLSQRFSTDLAAELPEVDAFIGLDQVATTAEIIERLFENNEVVAGPLNLVEGRSRFLPDFDTPRFRLTPSHFAYVKIAEGCNHPCSFCVIPQMRGKHRSRGIESVEEEVRRLVGEGVKEINLISQDTTYYGMDLWVEKAGPRQPVDSVRGPTLIRLLDRLASIEGEFWIRLLYTHPAHWSTELMDAVAANPRVAKYLDMPLQHIDERVLQLMRRETSRQHIEDLVLEMRARIPGVYLRTTFIVGFPGETEEQFEVLLDFIERTRFERLGVFQYSREEGSRAGKMPNQISKAAKQKRYRRAMELQQRIAVEWSESQVGLVKKVLVEQPLVARSEGDAPDVDPRVLLDRPLPVGGFANVRVTGTQVYDLRATPVATHAEPRG
ncbi:MAG: 30S ribosomal protein S12 methylthiotransferase RimO [Verrucomicrobia bacterium]|nr:30S ribosomal protein S12 methylthiotransferase RimO [Verrucomicrobiota bacterium]